MSVQFCCSEHGIIPNGSSQCLMTHSTYIPTITRIESGGAGGTGGGGQTGNWSSAVDHPSHYGGKDDPFEHIKVAEALGWGYHIGNCTKYLWRVGKKDPKKIIEDLKKAAWYLDRYIKLLESEQK